MVDSDMASEMMLSNFLNQEGRIISKIWYYSTELRVVGVQWVYRFTLLLFPNDWHMARTVGMAIMLAAFAGLMLFTGPQYRAGPHRCVDGRGAYLALWPYLPDLCDLWRALSRLYVPVCGIAYAGAVQPGGKQKKMRLDEYCCVHYGNAVRYERRKTLMVFQAPFVLAAMAVLILALNASEEKTWRGALRVCSQESRLMAGALATTMASFVGYIINSKVLAKMYSFKSFSGGDVESFWRRLDTGPRTDGLLPRIWLP